MLWCVIRRFSIYIYMKSYMMFYLNVRSLKTSCCYAHNFASFYDVYDTCGKSNCYHIPTIYFLLFYCLYIASNIYGHDWIDQWTACVQYSTIGTSVTFNMNSQWYTSHSVYIMFGIIIYYNLCNSWGLFYQLGPAKLDLSSGHTFIFVWRRHENMSLCTGSRKNSSYDWFASCAECQ